MNTNEIDPILAAWAFLALFAVLSIIAIVLRARGARKVRYDRARALHPAGKGLGNTPVRPPTVEATRHIDRVGFDWTK